MLTITKEKGYSGNLKVVIGITSAESHTLPYPDEDQYSYVYDVPY